MEGKSKGFKYTMFGLLYFTQGTIQSYFTALNAIYLMENGFDMTRIGTVGLIAMIPFVLKILFGYLSDRFNLLGIGHRKPYMLIGLFIQIASLIIVPQINPATNYVGFLAIAFILQFGMALYDTCTDGLALDTTPVEEEGTIQSIMGSGRAAGLIATATVVGIVADKVSWPAVFYVLAILTLFPLPFVLSIKDGEHPAGQRFNPKAFRSLAKKKVISVTGIGFIMFFIIVGINLIMNAYMDDRFGISLLQAGTLTTVWGFGILAGSIFGGRLFDKLEKRTVIYIGMGLSIFSLVSLAFIQSLWLGWVLLFIFGLSYGTYQTVFYAMAMGITDTSIAASMFAIIMSIINIAQAVGMQVSGVAVDKIGYMTTLLVFAALNFLIFPLLRPALGPKQPSV